MRSKVLKIVFIVFLTMLLIQIKVEATTLVITTTTDKDSYTLGEIVTATVSWDPGMQAAAFSVEYDENYLNFIEDGVLINGVAIADYFYTVETGKINVSWAELVNDDLDHYNMTFKFRTANSGNTSIAVTNPNSFADGNLVSPDQYEFALTGTKEIQIQKPTYIRDNLIRINNINDKTVLTGFPYTKAAHYKLNQLQNIFDIGVTIRAYDFRNNIITDSNALIGTGTKVEVYEDTELKKEYNVVIYGDTTGDGKINAIDALAVIKHINNKITFSNELFVEAGKVRKETLEAADALAIIKYINNKYVVNQ